MNEPSEQRLEEEWREWRDVVGSNIPHIQTALKAAFVGGWNRRQKAVDWMMRELIALNPDAEAHYRSVGELPNSVLATYKPEDQMNARANPWKGACSNCGGSGCDDCKWEGTASAVIIGEVKP